MRVKRRKSTSFLVHLSSQRFKAFKNFAWESFPKSCVLFFRHSLLLSHVLFPNGNYSYKGEDEKKGRLSQRDGVDLYSKGMKRNKSPLTISERRDRNYFSVNNSRHYKDWLTALLFEYHSSVKLWEAGVVDFLNTSALEVFFRQQMSGV